jgi:hypothetical protein
MTRRGTERPLRSSLTLNICVSRSSQRALRITHLDHSAIALLQNGLIQLATVYHTCVILGAHILGVIQ